MFAAWKRTNTIGIGQSSRRPRARCILPLHAAAKIATQAAVTMANMIHSVTPPFDHQGPSHIRKAVAGL